VGVRGRGVGHQAPGAELAAHAFDQLWLGGAGFGKAVGAPQAVPLRCAHLVEGENLDALNIRPPRDDLGDGVDVVFGVSESRHENEADPGGKPPRGKAVTEVDRRLQLASSDRAVGLGDAGFHVQQHEAHVIEHRVGRVAAQVARRVDGGVDAFRCRFVEDAGNEG